jgi:hypothetical protein
MSSLKRKDIVIPRGSTVKKGWPVRTADEQPAALGTFSARGMIRDAVTEQLYVNLPPITTFGANAGMYVDVEKHMIVLYIPASVSEGWTWKNGIYDIEMFNAETPPLVIRAIQGRIRLSKDMTRT